jgi:hypothetical protein
MPLGKPKRKRGRPKGRYSYKEKSVTAIRVTPSLLEFLLCEKKGNETFCDTAIRLLRERAATIEYYRRQLEDLNIINPISK